MRFMMIGQTIIMFECDSNESVLKAKSICREDIFSANQITDFRVIHNNLNYNFGECGEFGLAVRVDGKYYPFMILPNPNDLLTQLNTDSENGIINAENALSKFNRIYEYSYYIWNKTITNNGGSDDDLFDPMQYLDVRDRILIRLLYKK